MSYVKNEKYNNVSYFFVPFELNDTGDFRTFVDKVNVCGNWEPIQDNVKYLLRYITSKLDSTNTEKCKCYHFIRKAAHDDFIGDEFLYNTTNAFRVRTDEGLVTARNPFRILSVEMFVFSTSVGILAFKLSFENSDPLYVAAAEFLLKKVSHERLSLIGDNADQREKVSIIDIACKMLSDTSYFDADTLCDRVFFYSIDERVRANALTLVEVGEKDDYYRELYYLRNCYDGGFIYDELTDHRDECYYSSSDVVWGVTPETAVCLTCPVRGGVKSQFLLGEFYKNFNTQYLLLYVLLLHQKYVLYQFMMNESVDISDDVDVLEEYRNRLYVFEKDFVYSYVTEVPQYQNLYTKVLEAFHLEKMYEDVHEPLISLSEARRRASEDEQKKRDKRLNDSILMLSLLAIFSALVDSYDFLDKLDLGNVPHPITLTKVLQLICIVLVVIIGILVFATFIKNRKSR